MIYTFITDLQIETAIIWYITAVRYLLLNYVWSNRDLNLKMMLWPFYHCKYPKPPYFTKDTWSSETIAQRYLKSK